MYKYRLYGLNVLSDLQLDCFSHTFETADLHIRFTKSENEAKSFINLLCNESKPFFIYTNDCTWKIYICGKENIVVYYESDYDLKCSIIHFLLGFALSYILIMRRIFFLHGSCVVFRNSATVFIGNSGAGKSSLAAGFTQYGAKILSDDMTRLELNTKTPFVYPGYPTHRLYKNTIDNLGIDMSGAAEIIGFNQKYLLNNDSRQIFLDENVTINAIVYIRPSEVCNVQMVRESIKNSIRIIEGNIYNNRMIVDFDFISDYFDFILMTCEKIPIYTLQRPHDSFSIKEQVDVILREIYKEDKSQ